MLNPVTAQFTAMARRMADAVTTAGTARAALWRDLARAAREFEQRTTTADTDAANRVRAVFRPNAAETALANRGFDRLEQLHRIDGGDRKGVSYRAFSANGDAVFKPSRRRAQEVRSNIPRAGEQLAVREVAAYRIDRLFGFGRIPPTALIGASPATARGSVQQWIPDLRTSPGHPAVAGYRDGEAEQLAVLDYIMGHTDRHGGNYGVAGGTRELFGIDNELCLPEHADDEHGIKSVFTYEWRSEQTPLNAETMDRLHAVTPRMLHDALADLGIGEAAIDGAAARLLELQTRGRITGEAWPGRINAY